VQQGLHAEVYTATFTPLKARLAARAEGAVMQQGFVKMLVEVGSGKVLGLHMVGDDAPEIVQVIGMVLLLCTIPTAVVYSTCAQLCTRSSVQHLCSPLGCVVCRVL
jgi:pyruvate/2-oxoglutarate dehydrogenase complex dihydrolipoamide dehydrogenase (E3) component